MKSNKILFIFLLLLQSCGASNSSSSSATSNNTTLTTLPNGTTLPVISGPNVLTMTVDGSQCNPSNLYPNKPCVSVTICESNGTTCATVNDILVDTGSYGLRVFKSALPSSGFTLANENPSSWGQASGILTECAAFGSGSDWGAVEIAYLKMGGEPQITVPIQVINSDTNSANQESAAADKNCTVQGQTPDSGASGGSTPAGFNGILGVGLFMYDCDSLCSTTGPQTYYSCTGTGGASSCSEISVPNAYQVTNPIGLLPADNNGVILELPDLAAGGEASMNGYLIFGIGTANGNNTPSTSVAAYGADPNGNVDSDEFPEEFSTTIAGTNYPSFIDSGSNGAGFPAPSGSSLTACTGNLSGFYCPSSPAIVSATNIGFSGSPSGAFTFQIGNASSLLASSNPNLVFIELGESASGYADWGLPFFIGRNMYVGLQRMSSSLGTGPYWAY